jgi:hypothetical protein
MRFPALLKAIAICAVGCTLRATEFLYVTNESSLTITGWTGSYETAEIPASIEGIPVRQIGEGAFRFSTATALLIPAGVTNIAADAFRGSSRLQAVTIGDGVISIGENAFADCFDLGPLTLGNGLEVIGKNAFYMSGRLRLTSLSIPDSVEIIGDYAFTDSNLTTVTFGEGLRRIGSRAFASTSVGVVRIPKNVSEIAEDAFAPDPRAYYVDPLNTVYSSVDATLFNKDQSRLIRYGSSTFQNSYSIPSTVREISSYAFQNARSLTNVVIPNSVLDIGDYAFWQCRQLAVVSLGSNITNIGVGAFSLCYLGGALTVPPNVLAIGDGAFGECPLTNVTLPNGLKKLGAAFSRSFFPNIFIPASVEQIGRGCFAEALTLTNISVDPANVNYRDIDGVLFARDSGELIQYPRGRRFERYTIPTGTKTIGPHAFYFTTVASATIPDSVETIGEQAFHYCLYLTNVFLGTAVASIGKEAFLQDYNLSELTIPASVKEVGRSAFSGCAGLGSVMFVPGATNIGVAMFAGCSGLTNVTFREGLTVIPGQAFSGAMKLKSVNFPESLVEIGFSAFAGSGLEELVIKPPVRAIGAGAFEYNEQLKTVVLPATLESLDSWAFGGCYNLRSVFFTGDAPNGYGQFSLSSNAIAYYLEGRAGWGATMGGAQTRLWNPRAANTASDLGFFGDQFRIIASAPPGLTVVTEACEHLGQPWTPVATNSLASDSFTVADPSPIEPSRFYRMRVP